MDRAHHPRTFPDMGTYAHFSPPYMIGGLKLLHGVEKLHMPTSAPRTSPVTRAVRPAVGPKKGQISRPSKGPLPWLLPLWCLPHHHNKRAIERLHEQPRDVGYWSPAMGECSRSPRAPPNSIRKHSGRFYVPHGGVFQTTSFSCDPSSARV